MTYALVVHGGAGARPSIDYTGQREHLAQLIAKGGEDLAAGRSALDVVSAAVADLELTPIAGAKLGQSPIARSTGGSASFQRCETVLAQASMVRASGSVSSTATAFSAICTILSSESLGDSLQP